MHHRAARKTQVLMRNNEGEWEWVTLRNEHDERRWVMRTIMSVVCFIVVLGMVSSCARAAETLPNGMTCAQVVQAAQYLNIPNTGWGRAQARAIALTFGVWLTDAQLTAASRCLKKD